MIKTPGTTILLHLCHSIFCQSPTLYSFHDHLQRLSSLHLQLPLFNCPLPSVGRPLILLQVPGLSKLPNNDFELARTWRVIGQGPKNTGVYCAFNMQGFLRYTNQELD